MTSCEEVYHFQTTILLRIAQQGHVGRSEFACSTLFDIVCHCSTLSCYQVRNPQHDDANDLHGIRPRAQLQIITDLSQSNYTLVEN